MIGFSFSPGGLLLPYHLGVLAALTYHGHVTPDTPLAGSSAGAIAVAAHAAQVPTYVALEAAMEISAQCHPWFVAQGRLLPSLEQKLQTLLPTHAHITVNERPGAVGLAHLQLYPQPTRPVLASQSFDSRQALVDAVCDSSMFPYFTSNQPFRMKRRRNHTSKVTGRNDNVVVTVDGVFTEPLWRFGCPNTQKHWPGVMDRTVCVSVAPKELVGLGLALGGSGTIEDSKANNKRRRRKLQDHTGSSNVIAPPLQSNIVGQVTQLARLACTCGSRSEMKQLYEQGWHDAEAWGYRESQDNSI
jgi:hypothetical protein